MEQKVLYLCQIITYQYYLFFLANFITHDLESSWINKQRAQSIGKATKIMVRCRFKIFELFILVYIFLNLMLKESVTYNENERI